MRIAWNGLSETKPILFATASSAGLALLTFLRNDSVKVIVLSTILAWLIWLVKAVIEAIWRYTRAKIDAFFVEWETIGTSMSNMPYDLRELQIVNRNLADHLGATARHHEEYEREVNRKMESYENRMDEVEKKVAVFEARSK